MKPILALFLAVSMTAPSLAAPAPLAHGGGVSPIVRVEGGCGPEAHRDREGYCRPNFREERREHWREHEEHRRCPPGYHLGEHGERCWPN